MSGKSNYKTQIFINLPVKSLSTAIPFYTGLQFVQNHEFSNNETAMLTLPTATNSTDDSPIHLMLHENSSFTKFLPSNRSIADMFTTTQVLLCVTKSTRDELDEWIETAGKLGGKVDVALKQDHGWMYGRSFEDLDGHIWEAVWMDSRKEDEQK